MENLLSVCRFPSISLSVSLYTYLFLPHLFIPLSFPFASALGVSSSFYCSTAFLKYPLPFVSVFCTSVQSYVSIHFSAPPLLLFHPRTRVPTWLHFIVLMLHSVREEFPLSAVVLFARPEIPAVRKSTAAGKMPRQEEAGSSPGSAESFRTQYLQPRERGYTSDISVARQFTSRSTNNAHYLCSDVFRLFDLLEARFSSHVAHFAHNPLSVTLHPLKLGRFYFTRRRSEFRWLRNGFSCRRRREGGNVLANTGTSRSSLGKRSFQSRTATDFPRCVSSGDPAKLNEFAKLPTLPDKGDTEL